MKTATRKDWNVKRMPKLRAQFLLDRTFATEEMDRIKRGFIPEVMEQKWFIFFERHRLYVHRSWTGFCIYIAHFKENPSGYTILRVEVNRDPKQYNETDDAYDARLLSWLIDGALLGRTRPFPQKAYESSDDDHDDLEDSEPLATSEAKIRTGPPLNGDLMTPEERATEPGIGMLVAAERLGLIYLAKIPTMEKLLRDHAKEAVELLELSEQGGLTESQLFDSVEEVTQRLAKILRGEDPRYMAIPWFTDPNQLRQVLYDQYHASFGEDPEYTDWQADPVREACAGFLIGVIEILRGATEATPQEEILRQFNEHVRVSVALFLGIPESVYKYPVQESGTQPENSGGPTKPAA
jgi:hypothetical protein